MKTRGFTILAAALFLAFCFAQSVSAQIAVDKVTAVPGPNSNVTSLTFSHTVGTGSNRILVVGISLRDGSVSATGVTYGGKALTKIGARTNASNDNRTEMWYLLAPTSGAANVVINMSAAKRIVGAAISFTGVNQTTPLGTFVSASGQSSSASITATSAPGELLLDTVTTGSEAFFISDSAGQTERWNTVSGQGGFGNVFSGGSTEPGAGSVVMSWSVGLFTTWSIGAVPLKPAAAPPNVSLVKSVSPSGNAQPGTDLAYTVSFTNGGGTPASGLAMTDPIPTRTDFKVNSVKQVLGTTGLGVTVSYSNDGGTSWTYTPVSGGGSAPAGYDRNVTNIRWAFTGNLGQTSPNNSGSIGFTTRIR